MKILKIVFVVIAFISCYTLKAQVSINTDGTSADGSAMLDVKSDTSGILIPRMIEAQRDAISTPATGLLVFQTDGTVGFYYNTGSPSSPSWIQLSSTLITQLSDADGDTKIQVERTSDEDKIHFDVAGTESMTINNSGNVGIGTVSPSKRLHITGGELSVENTGNDNTLMIGAGGYTDYDNIATLVLQSGSGDNNYDQYNYIRTINTGSNGHGASYSHLIFGKNVAITGDVEHMRITSNGEIGIGTSNPELSAQVEISSTSKGFLPPRMTQAQRDLISSPVAGLLIYQTDETPGYYYYTSTDWIGITGAGPGAIPNSNSNCIDYDGNAYPTFSIGTQVWMAENLRVTHYNNGDPIPNETDSETWLATNAGAYCWYDNNQSAYEKYYGALYNWFAVDDYRGLCPDGWHVPTNAEWTTLTTYLGGPTIAGGKMKSESDLWNSPNTDATNSSNFSGLPGGCRPSTFTNVGIYGFWWSMSDYSSYSAWALLLYHTGGNVSEDISNKHLGFSVRCLRD